MPVCSPNYDVCLSSVQKEKLLTVTFEMVEWSTVVVVVRPRCDISIMIKPQQRELCHLCNEQVTRNSASIDTRGCKRTWLPRHCPIKWGMRRSWTWRTIALLQFCARTLLTFDFIVSEILITLCIGYYWQELWIIYHCPMLLKSSDLVSCWVRKENDPGRRHFASINQ